MTPRLQKIMEENSMKTWSCEIGHINANELPDGADWPLRKAVKEAYLQLTGKDAEFCSSGWGAERDKELLEIGEEISWQDGTAFYTDVNGQRWVHETDAIGCLKQLKLKLAARDEELAECKIAASVEAKAAEQARKQLAFLRKENERLKNLNGIVCECCTPCDCYLKKLQTQQQLLKECELVIRDANQFYYSTPPAYRKLLGKLTAYLEKK